MSEKYFSSLNYTLANEDTTMEVRMIQKLKPNNILTVAGSGGRSLPLVVTNPSKLYSVDLATDQILFNKLKLETFKSLSYEDFLLFWGFPPGHPTKDKKKRRELFGSLNLDSDVKEYFSDHFKKVNFEGLIYAGKWERTFAILSKVVRKILGDRFDEIFQFDSLEDQYNYYLKKFPINRWKFILFILGNKTVFDALLYKGNFIKKNVHESHYQYYFNAFNHIFTHQLAKKSFFANLCFYGEIMHQEGLTIEAKQDVFEKMKANFNQSKTEITFLNENLLGLGEKLSDIDFISLSDVPSYFDETTERAYLKMLTPCLNDGAHVVVRNYLRVTCPDLTDFVDVTEQFAQEIHDETVQMYKVYVYKYVRPA